MAQRYILQLITGVLIASVLILNPASTAIAAAPVCTKYQLLSGTCNVDGEINDGGVDLSGSGRTPGSGGGGSGGGGNPPSTPERRDPLIVDRDEFTVTGPLTIADIAHFRPTPGVDVMQPDGWMVVGLDTNFYAQVGTQVHTGTLLGEAAAVRFTPVAYHWRYGDGTAATRHTKGATWQALGLEEFDRTPTSHVYRNPGTYYIDLDISFTAEYRFADSSWIPVIGVLRVPANRLVATAGGAKTVLVEQECTTNPTGPGC